MFFNLTDQHSVANQFLYELRDRMIQKDTMRFRRNVERLGEVMAYEVSKTLTYQKEKGETQLKEFSINTPVQHPVLISILRAGIPYLQGFLNFFDHSECGFIGVYREEGKEGVKVHSDYLALPEINDQVVIVVDPMLATGHSMVRTVELILKKGTPRHLHIASVISAPEGVEYLKQNIKIPYSLWTCAVDENLNSNFYIVPGLGDAGDLSFGKKY